jgi:hypothetical protein
MGLLGKRRQHEAEPFERGAGGIRVRHEMRDVVQYQRSGGRYLGRGDVGHLGRKKRDS